MATPDRDIEIIPTTPTMATESSKGVAQDMDPNKKMSNTHTTNRDIAAPVTKSEFIALVVRDNIAAYALCCRLRGWIGYHSQWHRHILGGYGIRTCHSRGGPAEGTTYLDRTKREQPKP